MTGELSSLMTGMPEPFFIPARYTLPIASMM